MSLTTNVPELTEKIGFIGGGKMAKAICEGIVNKGLVSYQQVYVSSTVLENLSWWKEKGCYVFQEIRFVTPNVDVIFICVKPEFEFVLNQIYNIPACRELFAPKLYLSFMAGISLNWLDNKLNTSKRERIVRIMTNTPMTVGEGCSLFSGKGATKDDMKLVNKLLSATGTCKQVPEYILNAAEALIASGPAFIYMAIEALADGAVKMGVPMDLATELAAQMTLGAAKIARDSGKHTGQLKGEVCFPGGTTIQGVHALERGGMRAAFIDAVECASKRADQLRR
ncbi:uncharacterized protein LOC114341629 [Diabrotica virgifera virgifera]|uniref:pyrroline-5-carboxylate reductase n=1 Tax=Diabrotica virgifera virgifera TaxID=50390 RepID=A0ABM5JPC3_DIAVI|nr:uncharacterized protein LOC114341629 [Diabrotica virgifera virgifera]